MGEKIEGVLKPLLASSRPFGNPLELSEILRKKSDEPVRLSVGEGTNHNGLGLENWHISIEQESEIRNKPWESIRVPGNQDEGYQTTRVSGGNEKEKNLKPRFPEILIPTA